MKKGQEWSQEQLDYLIAHYPKDDTDDISSVIGKSRCSIEHKASRLNIHKDKDVLHSILSKSNSGANSGNFKGYRRKTPKGYITRYVPDHPSATKAGLVMEHRLVVEKALGITLPDDFDVHHINGDKSDNRIENLAIMTHKAHTILHNKGGRKYESTHDNR